MVLHVMLLWIVVGISLAQAISNPRSPHAVTLAWLRLGGLIAVSLLAVVFMLRLRQSDQTHAALTFAMLGWMGLAIAQLMTAQLGRRRTQRVFAALAFVVGGLIAGSMIRAVPVATPIIFILTTWLAGGLLGTSLMTMLLGHAYLTQGNEMTFHPFARLVMAVGVLLLLRLGLSLFALWGWVDQQAGEPLDAWTVMLLTARYLVGMVMPAVFTWMTHDCVKRRANQSATGILYVSFVMLVLGEGAALSLIASTGLAF